MANSWAWVEAIVSAQRRAFLGASGARVNIPSNWQPSYGRLGEDLQTVEHLFSRKGLVDHIEAARSDPGVCELRADYCVAYH